MTEQNLHSVTGIIDTKRAKWITEEKQTRIQPLVEVCSTFLLISPASCINNSLIIRKINKEMKSLSSGVEFMGEAEDCKKQTWLGHLQTRNIWDMPRYLVFSLRLVILYQEILAFIVWNHTPIPHLSVWHLSMFKKSIVTTVSTYWFLWFCLKCWGNIATSLMG